MEPVLNLRLNASYGSKIVLQDIALQIHRAEILGLVGESGCGKSTLSLAVLRLLQLKGGRSDGSIELNGRDLQLLRERDMRQVRGKEVALVLQSPVSALNPVLKIGTQLAEAWRAHQRGPKQECERQIADALTNVSLPCDQDFLRRRPSQLSVGQAQRVLIAMAILHRPPLLIADEPTSALDLITQSEILQLFRDLSRKLGMGILYISHDLLSVATIADRVAVMKNGAIVECRATADIFRNPAHPYTQQLIRALPVRPSFTLSLGAGAS